MGYSEALEQQVAMQRHLHERGMMNYIVQVFGRDTDVHTLAEFISEQAVPYWWSRDMGALAQSVAETIPELTLTEELLPTPHGFMYFSAPVLLDKLTQYEGRTIDGDLHAIGWATTDDGIRIIGYGSFSDQVDGISSRVVPILRWVWRFGQPLTEALKRADRETLATQSKVIRILGSCLCFIHQKILVTPSHRAERHAAKRLERQGWIHEPLIRVVELRRKASQAKPGVAPRLIEWSHQWVVGAHWRQQPYPSLGIVQPKLIMAYVKGPPDKPLSPPRAKVFAVVR